MEQRILLVHEVANLLRIAPVTVYRHLAQRRKGIGLFPLPISVAGGKLRFNAEDIEHYIAMQSNTAQPVKVSTARQQKREAKAFKQRQVAAEATLAKHRTVKRGQES